MGKVLYVDEESGDKDISFEQKKTLFIFLSICLILILIFGYISFQFSDKSNVLEFLDIRPFPSILAIITGMVANIVFGIIDNGGLFFGMSALDPFLPQGELTRA